MWNYDNSIADIIIQTSASSSSSCLKRIAIVGDGLASAICIDQLINVHGLHHIDIDVFTTTKDIGRGKAYSAETPETMLLNHKVKSMRFSDEDGHKFLSYLQKNYADDVTLYDFVPRRIFGSFVADEMATCFNRHTNLQQINSVITDIIPQRDSIVLSAGGLTREYRDVILCIGGGNAVEGLASHAMWDAVNPAGKNIALVGASLSAIDHVLHLYDGEMGKPEKITLLQRTPGFRMVRPIRDYPVEANVFTEDLMQTLGMMTADNLIQLIQAEINSHGLDYDLLTYGGLTEADDFTASLSGVLKRLARDPYNQFDQPEFKVFGIVKTIIPQIMEIFERELLSPEETEKFRQRAEKAVISYLAPMPPMVAERLAGWIDSGKLAVQANFDMNRDKADLAVFDHCYDVRGINAIGRSPEDLPGLMRSMIVDGIGKMSDRGGIAYDPANSTMLSGDNEGYRMPYLIGQLKKGQQFDNSESYVVYLDSKKVTRDLAERHRPQEEQTWIHQELQPSVF